MVVSFKHYYENTPLTQDAFLTYISLDDKPKSLHYEKEDSDVCIYTDVTLYSGNCPA